MTTNPETNDLPAHDKNIDTPDVRIAHVQRRWSEVLLTGNLFMPKPVHDRGVQVGIDPVASQPGKDVTPDKDKREQKINNGNSITP